MEDFKTIKDRLFRNYIFYIPSVEIDELSGTSFEGVIPSEACDTLAYFDDKDALSSKVQNLNVMQMASKKEILDENLLFFFNAKNNLEESHFKFLLGKYIPYIDSQLSITKWMYDNVQSEFETVDPRVVDLFKLQMEHFENHHKDLNKHFEIEKFKRQQKNERLAAYFKEKYEKPDFEIKVPKLPESELLKSFWKKQGLLDKKEIISDEEIDRYLLSKVFNVEV